MTAPKKYDAPLSDFELLDKIRLRHQIYAQNVHGICGILVGYQMARTENFQNDEIGGGASFLAAKNDVNPHAVHWTEQIIREAQREEYEIPTFFAHLDDFRGLGMTTLAEADLTDEQRHFDFHRRLSIVNVDYPELPLMPPHRLVAVRIPTVRVHAFYFDARGKKYYEQCFKDIAHLKRWAEDCFGLGASQWR